MHDYALFTYTLCIFDCSRGISSWLPELDPKFLGDPNTGEPFVQVLSIGREAERAPPICQKILSHSFGFQVYVMHLWLFFIFVTFPTGRLPRNLHRLLRIMLSYLCKRVSVACIILHTLIQVLHDILDGICKLFLKNL